MVRATLLAISLLLLCASMGVAIGGGVYEGLVLTPLWSQSPPRSFWVIQPESGVPLQRFWIPVHSAIAVFLVAAIALGWRNRPRRRVLLIGLGSYIIMRAWSFAYFIPEMLAFQVVPADSPVTAELVSRVERWTQLTWFRTPLDIVSFVSFVLAFRLSDRHREHLAKPHEPAPCG